MILGSFGNEPVNKIRHYVLAVILGSLKDHFELTSEENQTLCVRYITKFIMDTFGIVTVM